ncbi:MAG: alanine racemase [Cyclobacteriaceae bacterium]|nr:alanine racemase [Cyclobacteriaceae bacterium]
MKITRPTLIIDEVKCRANIEVMAQKANNSNTELIPHFKTHQSKEIGEWFKDYGVSKITVSSVKMAEYFAEAGWNDIYIAFPCNVLEVESINRLADKISLTLLFSNVVAIELLSDQLTSKVNARIEIDTGSDRSGFKNNNFEGIDSAINLINESELINLIGFYSHAGQSYKARNAKEINAVFDDMKSQLLVLNKKYELPISCGDTPCCSVVTHFDEFESIHPGNFAFYDVMQAQIGSCRFDQIGIALATPVVDVNHVTNEIVVHGGGVHLSKDEMIESKEVSYGKIVKFNKEGWGDPLEGCHVKSLSQEHGVVKATVEVCNSVKVGDILGILPVHSCMTADCMGYYYDLSGNIMSHLKSSY